MDSAKKVYLRQTEADRKHQVYWKMARDFMQGDRDTLISSEYLKQFKTELSPEAVENNLYSERKDRSYPLTLTGSIVLMHKANLAQNISFSEEVDQENEAWKQIIDDATGYSENINKAYAKVVCEYLAMGRVGVLVEGPAQVDASQEGAKQAGERSYQHIFKAEEIHELERFHYGPRKGQVRSVVLDKGLFPVQQSEEDRKNNKQRTFKRHYRRYFYAKIDGGVSEKYTVQELQSKETPEVSGLDLNVGIGQEMEVVTEAQGTLEQIPFYVLGEGPAEAITLRPVVFLDYALLSKISTISNTNHFQAFQKSIISGVSDRNKLKKFAAYIIHALHDTEVSVHTIPAGEATGVENERDFIIQWAKRLGMLQINQMLDDSSKAVQSAESRSKDLQALEQYYNDLLDQLEGFLNKIYRAHAEFEGLGAEDLQVTLARDFDGLIDPEQERANDALLLSSWRDLGESGKKIFKQVIARRVSKMRVVPEDGKDQTATRNELVEEIMAETIQDDPRGLLDPSQNPTILRNRERLNAQDSNTGRTEENGSAS